MRHINPDRVRNQFVLTHPFNKAKGKGNKKKIKKRKISDAPVTNTK